MAFCSTICGSPLTDQPGCFLVLWELASVLKSEQQATLPLHPPPICYAWRQPCLPRRPTSRRVTGSAVEMLEAKLVRQCLAPRHPSHLSQQAWSHHPWSSRMGKWTAVVWCSLIMLRRKSFWLCRPSKALDPVCSLRCPPGATLAGAWTRLAGLEADAKCHLECRQVATLAPRPAAPASVS